MKPLEYDFEPGFIKFFGKLVRVDNSFDHEFGSEKIHDYEIEDFEVMVAFGSMYEPVKMLDKKMEEYYKERFLEWAHKYNFDDVG